MLLLLAATVMTAQEDRNKPNNSFAFETPSIAKDSPAEPPPTAPRADVSNRYYQDTDFCPPLTATRDNWSLVQQCRSAVSAEKSLSLARWQLALTALTGLAIAATFFANWRSADTAEATLLAQQRAYIYPVDLQSIWEEIRPGFFAWRFRPIWENAGTTPARNLTLYSAAKLTRPVEDGHTFDEELIGPTRGFIAPKLRAGGPQAPYDGDAPILPEELIEVIAGTKRLYLWGWAKYQVVQSEAWHITKFCWMVGLREGKPMSFKPNTPAGQEGSLSFNYFFHTEGNCVDSECGLH